METSKMKNMVVLKNLPSNIIEEAIIILKASKKTKKLQKVEKNKNTAGSEKTEKDNGYIIKEAEMIVNNYITNTENKKQKDYLNKNIKNKYDKVKKYAIAITLMATLEGIALIF